jgi:raffinose/stachyose/melibiose transport system permease protein
MTTLAPPSVRVKEPTSTQRGRSGSVVWMAIPALLMFTAFGIIPLLGALGLSFTSWNGLGTVHFAGLSSWKAELKDPELPHALWVTFEIMALSWVVQTPMSILLGVFLAASKRYRGFLAVLYFIPLLLSSVAISITYKALLDPNFGIGNATKVSWLNQDWLGNTTLAIGTLVFVVSWQYVPFHSLIYQGAVRQIPTSMYEAAMIDGAGRMRQFFSITLPQIKYTIITSSTLMVVGSLTFFDLIWVLTAGGPGHATRALAVEMYRKGFMADLMGPASVIAVILVLVGLILAQLLRRLGGRGDESQLEGV